MKRIVSVVSSGFLALGILAVCANAGTINVKPAGMNGWTAENDESNTSSTFVAGTAPIGVGSFEANVLNPADSGGGVVLYTNAYDGLALSAVTGLGFSTFNSTSSNGESFDMVLGLSNGDALFYEPRYQGGSDTVALNTWQNWTSSTTTLGWYSEADGNYGPPLESLSEYVDANPGVTLTSIGVQAGYLDPVWTNFTGNVDAFSITSNTGINDTFNFDPNVSTPEPGTWLSLAGGLLLVGFGIRRRAQTAA